MNQAITDLFFEASKAPEYPLFGFNGVIILFALFLKVLATTLTKIAGFYGWDSSGLTEFASLARSSIFFLSLGTCVFLLSRSAQLRTFVLPHIFFCAAVVAIAVVLEQPGVLGDNATLQGTVSAVAFLSYIVLAFLLETHLNTYNGKVFLCTDPSVVRPETILATSFDAAKKTTSKTCLQAAQVTLRCVDKLTSGSKRAK